MQARKYITALMSDLPRKNGWTIAEHVGDATPDRTQRLLNHAVWDADEAMAEPLIMALRVLRRSVMPSTVLRNVDSSSILTFTPCLRRQLVSSSAILSQEPWGGV